MKKLEILGWSYVPNIMFEGEGEGAGGNSGASGGNDGSQNRGDGDTSSSAQSPDGSGSFYKPGDGNQGDGKQANDEGQSKGGDGDTRPDWLKDKYKTVEEQAKAYNDLYASYSKKTEDLKADVAKDFEANFLKERGVPEKAADYKYPEGVNPPNEALDKELRDWAHTNGVGADKFGDLINVYMKTQPDPNQEFEKLGDGAQELIDRVNDFVAKSVPNDVKPAVARIMQTADGIKFIEAMGKKISPSGFTSNANTPAQKPLTRDEIREMQADPRFGMDDTYTAMVRNHWQEFAKRGGQ